MSHAVDVFHAMDEKEGNLEQSCSLQMKSTYIAIRLIDRIDHADFRIGNVRKCYRMKGGLKRGNKSGYFRFYGVYARFSIKPSIR